MQPLLDLTPEDISKMPPAEIEGLRTALKRIFEDKTITEEYKQKCREKFKEILK